MAFLVGSPYLFQSGGLRLPTLVGLIERLVSFPCPCRVRSWEEKLVFGIMVAFLMGSLVASILGARSNAKRTLAFEEQFCREPEGLLYKQFTRLGKGAPISTLIAPQRAVLELF